MRKTAFVFPGQGAQSLGMGKELYENHRSVKKIYQAVSEISGIDVAGICFGEDAALLNATENCQTALFALSAGCLRLMEENGVTCAAVAGFSLGECTALYAAGMLSLEDAVRMILLRGQAMKKASERTDGVMCAVLGLDADTIDTVCRTVTDGVVCAVNYNSPSQTVIAGERSAVEQAKTLLTEAGASKLVPLAVAGAFHTKLMFTAGVELERRLKGFSFRQAAVPLYTNVTGNILPPGVNMPEHLKVQMTNPVRWQMSVERMLADGIDTFVELGAGRVLSGLIRRTARTAAVANVEDTASLEKTLLLYGIER